MRIIIVISLFGLVNLSYAQSPLLWSADYQANLTTFSALYKPNLPQIIFEDANSFKVVGRKNTPSGQRLSVVHYDLSGTVLSEQLFGGETVSNNQIADYYFDNSNHLYVLQLETIHINKSKIIFQKYSLNGDLIWVEEIEDAFSYSYFPISISISENNTLFIVAQKYIFDYDVYDEFSYNLFAFTASGALLWERSFDGYTELESIFVDYVYNNEIYLFGMDYGTFQVFKLLKVDTNNNITLNTFTDLQNGVTNLHFTQDNKLLVTAAKYRISKMNMDGSLLWSEYFQENPPMNPYLEEVKSSIQDDNGNTYITGRYWKHPSGHPNNTNNDVLTLKFDSDGNLIWQNLYQYGTNNADIGEVITLRNGNIYVGGYSQNNGIGTNYGYMILKINAETGISNGVYRYNSPTEGSDRISSIYVFDDGKLALTGLSHNGTHYNWTTQLLSDVTLSVESVNAENKIKIYPNPLQKERVLSIEGSDLRSYSVYDVVGKMMQQGVLDSGDIHRINLKNLTKGMYVLRLKTDKKIIVKKIILE